MGSTFLHSEVKLLIEKSGKPMHYTILNFSLEVPPNAVDEAVNLEIVSLDTGKAPPIPCKVGETILSDVLQISPVDLDIIQFKAPVILSFKYGITEVPELSSTIIMCYNYDNEEWKRLPPSPSEDQFLACIYLLQEIYTIFLNANSNTG